MAGRGERSSLAQQPSRAIEKTWNECAVARASARLSEKARWVAIHGVPRAWAWRRLRVLVGAASQVAARRARKDQLSVDDRIDLEPVGLLEIGLECAQGLIPLDPHL